MSDMLFGDWIEKNDLLVERTLNEQTDAFQKMPKILDLMKRN